MATLESNLTLCVPQEACGLTEGEDHPYKPLEEYTPGIPGAYGTSENKENEPTDTDLALSEVSDEIPAEDIEQRSKQRAPASSTSSRAVIHNKGNKEEKFDFEFTYNPRPHDACCVLH
uniref:Uncharacterized protein n=1 Tax=Aureoumbra lagunensis TaxID=44058 RepID=A0A7S3K4B2_9STRA|mmetsp:Transcript_1715/g.2619  ORF Transcript_1715/g.2619 Transcript_1715/m.2619 type:complete len:118 (+) Transcript_1715:185-538(+)|eukprot:CAMPEP_0197315916 /NCGR_PEP_ID=MMETSP0891-20130614/39805_1 /TAXON_ID=44058 ORGANISM="Aureoumbra lagunensis, Strain CCMP1510" /NCGR_SAMPLE_ID=MMETSP0891 /ASSEMBLY_ACC=CAM_ASM_000534 /LENGTH=117 /DNA_ID=CAMNT_0042805099 /DNA_START=127 /DNA_END=480 /DNA_ORIENTATION=+